MKTLIFLCFILILSLAGLGYVQFEKLQNESLQTNNAVGELKSNISKVNSKEEQTKADLAELQGKYQSIRLDENWKISEAIHLLRLAGVQLQVSRDIPTTLHLLEAADNQLDSIQDPSLLPIRDQISKEKLALKEAKMPNIEKLWLQVGTLIDQIPSLKTQGLRSTNTATNAATNVASDSSTNSSLEAINTQTVYQGAQQGILQGTQQRTQQNQHTQGIQQNPQTQSGLAQSGENDTWKKNLESAWGELKGLIRIQEHNTPIQPILTASEQALAKENLLLIMEQLRWAILHTNNTVYQRSITEAKHWLSQYFEASDSKTQEMQAELDALAAVDLRPALPELGEALKALQKKG